MHVTTCTPTTIEYTVNPQLSEPRLSGSSIIRITNYLARDVWIMQLLAGRLLQRASASASRTTGSQSQADLKNLCC